MSDFVTICKCICRSVLIELFELCSSGIVNEIQVDLSGHCSCKSCTCVNVIRTHHHTYRHCNCTCQLILDEHVWNFDHNVEAHPQCKSIEDNQL